MIATWHAGRQESKPKKSKRRSDEGEGDEALRHSHADTPDLRRSPRHTPNVATSRSNDDNAPDSNVATSTNDDNAPDLSNAPTNYRSTQMHTTKTQPSIDASGGGNWQNQQPRRSARIQAQTKNAPQAQNARPGEDTTSAARISKRDRQQLIKKAAAEPVTGADKAAAEPEATATATAATAQRTTTEDAEAQIA